MASSTLRLTAIRVAWACLFGLALSLLAFRAAIQADQAGYVYEHWAATGEAMKKIEQAINLYRQEKHRLPRTLGDLRILQDPQLRLRDDGTIYDGWAMPFHYQVNGTNYVIISYGRDGKPGGVGVNADLTSNNLPSKSADILSPREFIEYFRMPDYHDAILTALFTGLLAALLCLKVTGSEALVKMRPAGKIVSLLVLLVATAYTAAMMTFVHIHPGH
jgi:hypothetical protein